LYFEFCLIWFMILIKFCYDCSIHGSMEPVQSRMRSKSTDCSWRIATFAADISLLKFVLCSDCDCFSSLLTLLLLSSSFTMVGLCFDSSGTLGLFYGTGLWNLKGHVESLFLQVSPNLQGLLILPGYAWIFSPIDGTASGLWYMKTQVLP